MLSTGSCICKLTNGNSDIKPIYSNNGQAIAYLSLVHTGYQIFLMRPDGKDRRQITYFPTGIFMMCFSPDDKKLFYTVPTVFEKSHQSISAIFLLTLMAQAMIKQTK